MAVVRIPHNSQKGENGHHLWLTHASKLRQLYGKSLIIALRVVRVKLSGSAVKSIAGTNAMPLKKT